MRDYYNITTLPAIIAFVNGVHVLSNRDLFKDEILTFLKLKLNIKVTVLKTKEEATALTKQTGLRVKLLAVIYFRQF